MARYETSVQSNINSFSLSELIGFNTIQSANPTEVVFDAGGIDIYYRGAFGFDNATQRFTGTISEFSYEDSQFFYSKTSSLAYPVSSIYHFIDTNNPYGLLTDVFSGADTIIGSEFGDVLGGFRSNDYIVGSGGNDILVGGTGQNDPYDGSDVIDGGQGFDLVYANAGNDTVIGGRGNDTIWGNSGDDSLSGGQGVGDSADIGDTIYGNIGNDIIRGNGGDDLLYGNAGNDTLYGGLGNDQFGFSSINGDDVVEGFEGAGVAGGDYILLSANINGTGIITADQALSHAAYANGNAIIDLGFGDSVTLTGVTLLSSSDFIIV